MISFSFHLNYCCFVTHLLFNKTVRANGRKEQGREYLLSVSSLFKFTTNAQEEFKQVTIKTIDAYCSAYSRACVTIRIEEVSR